MAFVRVFSCLKHAIPSLRIPAFGNIVIEKSLVTDSVLRTYGSHLVVVDEHSRRVQHIGDKVPSEFITKCRVRGPLPTVIDVTPPPAPQPAPPPEPEPVQEPVTTTTVIDGEAVTTTTEEGSTTTTVEEAPKAPKQRKPRQKKNQVETPDVTDADRE